MITEKEKEKMLSECKEMSKKMDVCDMNTMSKKQAEQFDKKATSAKLVSMRFTLNESTTVIELLKEAHAVAMMRAAKGYPKGVLITMTNCAEELYVRMGLASQRAFVKLHSEVVGEEE